MKLFAKISIIVWVLSISAQASSYIYLDGEALVELKDEKVNIYNGTPVEILETVDDKVKIQIKGYTEKENPEVLYATPNRKVPLISLASGVFTPDAEGKANATFLINEDMVENDIEIIWEENIDEFYNTCTQCHAANEPHLHSMLEWDGLYGSMKEFAKPSAEQDAMILRFLRAFASDGFVAFP